MSKNRFEQVDELQPDAICLTLTQDNDGQHGSVFCPASALPGRLKQDMDSGPLPARDAMLSAVKLANDVKLAIVVVDPENIWKKDWGTLYRPLDD